MHRCQTAHPYIWTLCPPHRHSIKQFSHRPQGVSLLSQTGLVNCPRTGHCSVYYDLQTYCRNRPEVKQLTMTPKSRALSPTHKRATCSNLSN
ncbi:hypothetical protein TNCV_4806751 [Trichonephila clavipes]|nr:hypothetical protein TNCV_4806751 [Trichonephila clavipes]